MPLTKSSDHQSRPMKGVSSRKRCWKCDKHDKVMIYPPWNQNILLCRSCAAAVGIDSPLIELVEEDSDASEA